MHHSSVNTPVLLIFSRHLFRVAEHCGHLAVEPAGARLEGGEAAPRRPLPRGQPGALGRRRAAGPHRPAALKVEARRGRAVGGGWWWWRATKEHAQNKQAHQPRPFQMTSRSLVGNLLASSPSQLETSKTSFKYMMTVAAECSFCTLSWCTLQN